MSRARVEASISVPDSLCQIEIITDHITKEEHVCDEY